MVDTIYTENIKNLFQEYYKRNISFAEYREQRRKLIEQMDKKYNGQQNPMDYHAQHSV